MHFTRGVPSRSLIVSLDGCVINCLCTEGPLSGFLVIMMPEGLANLHKGRTLATITEMDICFGFVGILRGDPTGSNFTPV